MKLQGRVLVTGGAGYIGSHAVEQLIPSGAEVFIYDNLSTGYRKLLHPEAKFIEGDVRNTELVHRVLVENKIDSIIHFAAFTSVAESVALPEKYYDNNFIGTLNLLKALQGTPVQNFVFSSTAAVYSDPGEKLVDENSLTDPLTPYGRSKLMSEACIQDYSKTSGLRSVILRYFNVAGASLSGKLGQCGDEHTVLIKRAALAAAGKIKRLEIFGTDYTTVDGTAVRDYIHIEDLAELHLLALDMLKQGIPSTILNCGYGHGFSVKQVVNTMKKVSGKDFDVVEKPRRSGDLGQVVASVDKLKKLTNWRPKRDNLELICQTAYQWEVQGQSPS